MTNPKESSEEKPSSSEQQQPAGEKNGPQNAPGAQEERTGQNESNVSQSDEKSDENVGGGQEKTGQNKSNVSQTGGDAGTETEGSGGGDNVKGQGDGDHIQKGTPDDQEADDKNVTQTEKGQESGGSSSASISARKRGRSSNPIPIPIPIHVGSSSTSGSGSKARKKGEVEVPSCAPTCYVCKKTYASWKAVFGHLRAHRRQTPGAFPPPTFTPEGSPERKGDKALKEQLAPTLLNLARETMQKMSQDSNTTVEAGVASSSGRRRSRGLDIDLNEPRTSFLLDLNDPPPPEKDVDDEDDQN